MAKVTRSLICLGLRDKTVFQSALDIPQLYDLQCRTYSEKG